MNCAQAGIGPVEIPYLFARMQRERFTAALRSDPTVLDVLHTDGLPLDYLEGAQLVVVLPQPMAGALTRAQELLDRQVYRQAGQTRVVGNRVRCRWSQHSAREPLGQFVPTPPSVEVMPAFRDGDRLRLPQWPAFDATELLELVAERQRQWSHFADVARMVKAWNRHQDLRLNSVAVDVLVTRFRPWPGPWQTLTRAEALARFFSAAAEDLDAIRAPGTGRVIDPGPDYSKLCAALTEAADHSREAADAAIDGDRASADLFWGKVFGDAFGPGWLVSLLRWTWDEEPGRRHRPDVLADWPRPDRTTMCGSRSTPRSFTRQ